MLFALCVALAAAAAPQSPPRAAVAEESREVVLAVRRDRRLHVFDAETLEPLGHFVVHDLAHSVSARPDGRVLFIAQAAERAGDGCCALFALDLETKRLCRMIEPAMWSTPSPDGRLLFTQRGAVGVEVFDARTLEPLARIDAPGNYGLHPSPDGRWLFGTTNWRGPSLDIIDVERRVLVRRLPLPEKLLPRGAWVGGAFYLYGHDGTRGLLWRVTPDTTSLGEPTTVALPGKAIEGAPLVEQVLIPAGESLLLYEPFGWWFHVDIRRERGGAEVPGGFFRVEPGMGRVLAHLAPSIDFAQLVPGPGARHLYGLDAGRPAGGRGVRLLKLDASTGRLLAERALEGDVWHIRPAALPRALLPRGEVRPSRCPQ